MLNEILQVMLSFVFWFCVCVFFFNVTESSFAELKGEVIKLTTKCQAQ